MSNNVQAAAASAAPPTFMQKFGKWVYAIATFFILAGGVIKLVDNFTLPNCDSSRALDTVRSIFKDKNLPEPTLTGQTSVTNTSAEKTCQTAYALPNEKGTLDYKVFWEGWSVKVMITKVQ